VEVVSWIVAVVTEFNEVLFRPFRLVQSHVHRSVSRFGVSSYGVYVRPYGVNSYGVCV
jgi:hypothetical protein